MYSPLLILFITAIVLQERDIRMIILIALLILWALLSIIKPEVLFSRDNRMLKKLGLELKIVDEKKFLKSSRLGGIMLLITTGVPFIVFYMVKSICK